MNIAIRVDASLEIGTGHLMRCLTLAEALRSKGAEVVFVCREHMGNLFDYIEFKKFKLHRLPFSGQDTGNVPRLDLHRLPPHASWLGVSWQKDAQETIEVLLQEKTECLIVDHFGIDASWEHRIKEATSSQIAIIDGQLDRAHDCDFLLDPNLTEKAYERWASLVPSHCQLFLGPRFSFLRPEFIEERRQLRPRGGSIKRILIAFGGVDKTNATEMALNALRIKDFAEIAVDVVAGPGKAEKPDLERTCRTLANVNFYFKPPNMAKLMAEADIAIGAGGTMVWERCYLGLPTIIMSVADNQDEICRSLVRKGACIYLGKQNEVRTSTIRESINALLMNPELLRSMGALCMKIMGESETGMHEFCKTILQ